MTLKERIREIERDMMDLQSVVEVQTLALGKISDDLFMALATITELEVAMLDVDNRVTENRASIGPALEAPPVRVVD